MNGSDVKLSSPNMRNVSTDVNAENLHDTYPIDLKTLYDIQTEALSANAARLLQERFLLEQEDGTIETPEQMMHRVARVLADQEIPEHQKQWQDIFFIVMTGLLFHSGSRVLANAGTTNQQLANCFVLPLKDNRHAILKTFAEACDIKGNGGGCGFNYSALRPRGAQVREHDGLACGPTAILKLFDEASNIFRQKGRYESGNMAILNIDHPDIIEFISVKEKDGTLRLTNISVGVTNEFMQTVEANGIWQLQHPATKESTKIPARELFSTICELAWRTGDPGFIFLDRINKDNTLLEAKGPIAATNTCGEIGLFEYESCNLGYLNLVNLLADQSTKTSDELFNIPLLRATVHVAVRMIDNAISSSWFPIEAINKSVRENRRVGLGLTGWADCLSISGIPYDSENAFQKAEQLSKLLREFADEASIQLAKEKGPYPNSVLSGETDKRNIALLALPPSGNNAIIFDTSFSIEPHFSLSYTERVMGNQTFQHRNKHLVDRLKSENLNVDEIFDEIEQSQGSVQAIDQVPDAIKACYKTAHEIAPEAHVRMQAAFQKHVDNAVTKTVNLPQSSTPEDVAEIYKMAWKHGCKGITVYRDGSRSEQAIEFEKQDTADNTKNLACEECADISAIFNK